ncbi:MAG: GNAT family N-acetyltransferase [Mobilitalea sp.]
MNSNYTIVKAYQDNALLRNSFNNLAGEIFALNFEDWYQHGYWGDKYIPYSIVDKGIVVANVSVNIMDFECNGTMKRYIQIGTVMTKSSHRNQGLSRCLMKEVLKDYKDNADGIFLFANDSVLEFYPKFGFRKGKEYQYTKDIDIQNEFCAIPTPMQNKEDRNVFEKAIKYSVCNSSLDSRFNVELIMFYITKFMNNNVFFIESQNAYVIAEVDEDQLKLFNVFSAETADLEQIIKSFGQQIKKVTLEFTPLDKTNYTRTERKKDDTTLFLLGEDFKDFEEHKMMFPELSYA